MIFGHPGVDHVDPQIKNLLNLYEKYKTKNFEILGVSLDGINSQKSFQDWINAIEEDKLYGLMLVN